MYESAACGLGVALAVPLLLERFVQDGRLRPCATEPVPIGMSYALYHGNPQTRTRPVVRVFIEWLHHEIAASLRDFDRWCETPPLPAPHPSLAAAISEA